ncbi:M4 family metallopeptidase [Legionella bononiensis]|uniref:Neutral metalloproteinase n=1 Tax=Legionella bononiensis TaxID=2793102 RepID=A0ABS1WFN0_9GAMM|nr:M4 family metallopeptidase [Legionella bononiensis]MBL7481599.1 M4 family metallopeptidase [Legionella bononiensis]MBL7528146.1 M4 family metallopeptidase [Legionella bononiensis]MBL7562622.1 M4 family metallopeptidase [Legionella bononiensis]
MKKRIASFLVISAVASSVQAASQNLVWGDANKSLPQFEQKNSLKQGLIKSSTVQQSDYKLQLQNESKTSSNHARYQLTYKGIPVWGYQVIFHSKKGSKDTVTGMNVTGIEKDISSINGVYSADEIEQKILGSVSKPVKFKNINKIIFIDTDNKAHLAYHLSYYSNSEKAHIKAPNYLIDANTAKVLKQWDEVRHERIGQGLGGNAFPLPYRGGMFQHGNALPGLPSLGKFDVSVKDGICSVENETLKVMNLENHDLGYDVFPITTFAESMLNIPAFSYACDESNFYLNYADGATGPVNYAFSPVNDTMYFAQQTLDMYEKIYGVKKPIGDDLPLRAYTHLGDMDNAFAIPTISIDGLIVAHQQIVIGNGDEYLTAPAQSVIGHELSHNFTAINSGLLYEGQSGGINESFSDMAAIALQDYLRRDYPWYWDGEDWTIGREAVKGGQPLRYMDDPTKDGLSIGNAAHFTDSLDVHMTSGVFNKAFYVLAHKPGWSIQKAFQIMVDANMNYWSPIAYYDFAACGVIQAAIDRKFDKTPVIEAFAEVGVVCPMHKA